MHEGIKQKRFRFWNKKKKKKQQTPKTKTNTVGRRAAGGAPQGPNKRDASDLYDQSPSLQPEQGWHPNNMGGFKAAKGGEESQLNLH